MAPRRKPERILEPFGLAKLAAALLQSRVFERLSSAISRLTSGLDTKQNVKDVQGAPKVIAPKLARGNGLLRGAFAKTMPRVNRTGRFGEAVRFSRFWLSDMSRAFTKEIDDVLPVPVPDRPVSGAPNLVTPAGAAMIAEKLEAIAAALETSGDREQIAQLRRDERYWLARKASTRVMPLIAKPSVVAFGTRVQIQRHGNASWVRIVGEDEADPASGCLAWTSPLARALDGANTGETVEFKVAGRVDRVTVLSITE